MKIFKDIKSSVWNPSFYGEVEKESLGASFGYYAKLSLLVGLCFFIFSLFLIPSMRASIKDFQGKALSSYPSGLEISLTKGIASTNASTSPFVVPMKQLGLVDDKNIKEKDVRLNGVTATDYTNFLVIDTVSTTTPSIESFKGMKTFFLLSKNYLVTYDKNINVVFYDLSRFPDLTINQGLLQKLLGFANYLPFIVPILFFFGGFFFSFFSLFSVLIGSLILKFIEYVIRHNITFSSAFKTCVHASTLPLILNIILLFIGLPIPFIFVLLTLIIALANINGRVADESLSA